MQSFDALFNLLTKKHAKEKVIVFTQFADTVRYLESQLRTRGLQQFAASPVKMKTPTGYAWRFSPTATGMKPTKLIRPSGLKMSFACCSPRMF